MAAELSLGFNLGLNLFDAPVIDRCLFIGRETEIQTMKDVTGHSSRSPGSARVVLVLGGAGGMGKTQLAITFAHHCCDDFDAIFWLNAMSHTTLQDSLRRMAERIFDDFDDRALSNARILARLKRWLSDRSNTRWLLIFDNYDDPKSYNLQEYYPYTSHGTIMVTTRRPYQVAGHQIIVQPLQDIGQGLRILDTRSQRQGTIDDPDARRVAERLAGLPLALATAGTLLRQTALTFRQYLQAYEQNWNLSHRRPLQLHEYQDKALCTTWNLSYTRLEQEDEGAAQLLKLLAYFGHQPLWYELFHAGLRSDLPEWLVTMSSSIIDFNDTMRVLVDYCFVEAQSTTRTYAMHACVHDWTLAELNRDIDLCSYWFAFDCVAMSTLNEEIGSLGHYQFARLVPHALRLTRSDFLGIDTDGSDARIFELERIALLLDKQDQHAAAEMLFTQALADRKAKFGSEHILTLSVIENLGNIYCGQGKLVEAESMYVRALAGYEGAIGADATFTLGAVTNLGQLYRLQGKLVEAERMSARALEGYEKLHGQDHVSPLRTFNDLGLLYTAQGRLDKAEEVFTRALAGLENRPGVALTLNAVINLGNVYQNQGRLTEAEQMCARALAEAESVFGANHASTLRTVLNLGNLYLHQGKLKEAERMYARALDGKENLLGADHPSTLMTLNNMGNLYDDQNRSFEAEQAYTRALFGFEKLLGPEHPSTLNVVNNLGVLFTDSGRLTEAEQMHLRALAGYRKVFGPDHVRMFDTMHNLGRVYHGQNRFADAEKAYKRSFSGYETQLGIGHTSTLNAFLGLAQVYFDQGRFDQPIEQMYLKVLAGYEKAQSPEHKGIKEVRTNLGELYKSQGRLEEAKAMFAQGSSSQKIEEESTMEMD